MELGRIRVEQQQHSEWAGKVGYGKAAFEGWPIWSAIGKNIAFH